MKCELCGGERFHTQYIRNRRAAWVCDKCRATVSIDPVVKKKKRKYTKRKEV